MQDAGFSPHFSHALGRHDKIFTDIPSSGTRRGDRASKSLSVAETLPRLEWARVAVEKTPSNVPAFYGLLYATLALPEGDAMRNECTKRLMLVSKDQPALQAARLAAAALLKTTDHLDTGKLTSALGSNATEDALVLAALACRAAGPESWQTYRRASRELLHQTPVPGSVVVLINNL